MPFRFRVTLGGSWSACGASCSITSATTMGARQQDDEIVILDKKNLMEDISIEAYPNPNNGEFTISSTQEGTFLVNKLITRKIIVL